MLRSASAVWHGTDKEGHGEVSCESGCLDATNYSFRSRHEAEPGTNPEELLAAAQASCFVMSLALALRRAGYAAERLEASAALSLLKDAEGLRISKSVVTLDAKVPDIEEAELTRIADREARECPVSKAMATADLTLEIRSHAA